MNPGDILCFKSTGELCVFLKKDAAFEDKVYVRRPIMTHEEGIKQSTDNIYAFELETVEEHLRREAKEMVLKTKIQEEMMEELEKGKRGKPAAELVN